MPSPRLQGCVPQKGKGCTNYPQLTWLHWPQSLLCIASHLPGTGYCHLLLLGCLHSPCKKDLGFEFLFNTLNPQASEVVETQLAFLGPICTSPCSPKLPSGVYSGPTMYSLSKIHFNMICPSKPVSSIWSLSLSFPEIHSINIPHFPMHSACTVPSHPPWVNHANINTQGE